MGDMRSDMGSRTVSAKEATGGHSIPSLPEHAPLEPYPFAGYYNWAGGYGTYLQYWYNSGSPSEGTILCHQGFGSGEEGLGATQCGVTGATTETIEAGTIHGVYYEWHLKPVLRVNQTVICPGDSGGPWFVEELEPNRSRDRGHLELGDSGPPQLWSHRDDDDDERDQRRVRSRGLYAGAVRMTRRTEMASSDYPRAVPC